MFVKVLGNRLVKVCWRFCHSQVSEEVMIPTNVSEEGSNLAGVVLDDHCAAISMVVAVEADAENPIAAFKSFQIDVRKLAFSLIGVVNSLEFRTPFCRVFRRANGDIGVVSGKNKIDSDAQREKR